MSKIPLANNTKNVAMRIHNRNRTNAVVKQNFGYHRHIHFGINGNHLCCHNVFGLHLANLQSAP